MPGSNDLGTQQIVTRLIEATDFGTAAASAKALCSTAPVMNLLIRVHCPIPTPEDAFLYTFYPDAKEWQSPTPSPHLQFTHGEYMFRGGDPIDFMSAELKNKPTSNRACVSLVNAGQIRDSGDGKLPSFMLLQAGLDGVDGSTLHLAAYYRALEVESFLPINLAEMALLAQQLQVGIPALRFIDLALFAFRAHSLPYSRPHVLALLDQVSAEEIQRAVDERELDLVLAWLIDKARPETLVDSSNLAVLTEMINTSGWIPDAMNPLQRAVTLCQAIGELRKSASHSDLLSHKQAELEQVLGSVLALLEERRPS